MRPLSLLSALLLGLLASITAAEPSPTEAAAEAVTPVAIEQLVPLTAPGSAEAQVEAAIALADEPAPKQTLATQVDSAFGTWLVAPLWQYFLGVPLFQHDTQVITYVIAPSAGTDDAAAVAAAKQRQAATLSQRKKLFNQAGVIIGTDSAPRHLLLVPSDQAAPAIEVLATLEAAAPPRILGGEPLHGLVPVAHVGIDGGDAESRAAAVAALEALAAAGLEPRLAFARGFTPIAARSTDLEAARTALSAAGAPVIVGGATGKAGGVPFIVLVLVFGGLFFTLRYAFVNVRLFRHAIACVRGKYDDPDDDGEISHFKALTSALSATVGLGNIAGVALAITAGGPGAVFWMWLVAFFGMSMKFTSCTLAQLYRRVKDDGSVLGGPMIYIQEGFAQKLPGAKVIGRGLAILFAVLCIMSSFGGGNMFQGNQAYSNLEAEFLGGEGSTATALGFGLVLAALVGVVILGGIRRIGEVTSKLVPLMCGFYCLVCLIIILANIANVPAMFASIFAQAFSPEAAFGGFIGVLVQGMTRAAFSNEAGLGSAAIAHSAAKTKEPVREGLVAMLGPFIDTIVVCTMTALAILITGAHLDAEGLEGIKVTRRAFEDLGGGVPLVLLLAVVIFAYSTMIAWAYYGERASEYLFGPRGVLPYRILFVIVVAIGPVMSLGNVLAFSDLMLLSMAFPNIIGMTVLSGVVYRLLKDYRRRYAAGEMHLARDWRVHHPDDAKTEDAGGQP